MEDLFRKAYAMIGEAKRILIVSHRDPDADTLGAGIALYDWLKGSGKSVDLLCMDKTIDNLKFLPYVDLYVNEFNAELYDLIISVDIATRELVGFDGIFDCGVPVINIDHHSSNDLCCELDIVDPKAASTTMILFEMFTCLGVGISEEMATALLAGIYGDTGSFMHSNTELVAYKVAADLVKMGARIDLISKFMFRTRPLSTLKLWGTVLENVHMEGGDVVVSELTEEDFVAANADPKELSGIVDYLNMVPDAKFSLLINEDRKGNVRGSLRTRREDVDVSEIAAIVGGGGHAKASGFTVAGDLDDDFVKKNFLN